jgi:hypothetical protein
MEVENGGREGTRGKGVEEVKCHRASEMTHVTCLFDSF